MTFDHPGRFTLLDAGSRPGCLVLRRDPQDSEPAVEYLFANVTRHDLPPSLNGINVREFGDEVTAVSLRTESAPE